MRADIDQPGLDLGDPVRIVRRLGLVQQRIALEIGREHHLDQAFRPVWGFLREAADAPARRDGDGAALGRHIAANRLKQRRLADPVAADKADPRAGHDLHGTLIDQQPSGDPDRDVGDGEHAAFSPEPPAKATRLFKRNEAVALPASSFPTMAFAASRVGLTLNANLLPGKVAIP